MLCSFALSLCVALSCMGCVELRELCSVTGPRQIVPIFTEAITIALNCSPNVCKTCNKQTYATTQRIDHYMTERILVPRHPCFVLIKALEIEDNLVLNIGVSCTC